MYISWISIWEKGWRVYNLEIGVISISRDVVFHELVSPFLTNDHVSSSSQPLLPLEILDNNDNIGSPPGMEGLI